MEHASPLPRLNPPSRRQRLARGRQDGILNRMPSLNSIVAMHRTVLLIDSASSVIQVGLLRDDCEVIWQQAAQESGIAVFACADAALAQARIEVVDIGAFVFCEGPGSILGIRTAAMAIRTWSVSEDRAPPAFAYRSLELLASDLQTGHTPAPFAVVADARRDSWHWVDGAADGSIGPLRRVPAQELAAFTGGVFTPSGFRAWAQPLRPISTISYDLPSLWLRQRAADLLRPAPQPDAFLHEDATYVTWTPRIHRTGVAPSQTRANS